MEEEYDETTISSSPSIDGDEIDFEFVYALRTFTATEQGQASATKGDAMVLLNDSNSYWWLVRVVKDATVGFLPAEHIETPTERLARLNKHRNGDLCSSTYPSGDNNDGLGRTGSGSKGTGALNVPGSAKSPVSPLARFFGRKTSNSSVSTVTSTSNSSTTTTPTSLDSSGDGKPTSIPGANVRKSVRFHDHPMCFSASDVEFSDDYDDDDDDGYYDDEEAASSDASDAGFDHNDSDEETSEHKDLVDHVRRTTAATTTTTITTNMATTITTNMDAEDSDDPFDDLDTANDPDLSAFYANPGHIPIQLEQPITRVPPPAHETLAPLRARNSLLVAHSHQDRNHHVPVSQMPKPGSSMYDESIFTPTTPGVAGSGASPADANNLNAQTTHLGIGPTETPALEVPGLSPGKDKALSSTTFQEIPTAGGSGPSSSTSIFDDDSQMRGKKTTPKVNEPPKGFKSFMKKVGLGSHGIQGEDLGADILNAGAPSQHSGHNSDFEEDQITPLNVKSQFKRRSLLNTKSSVEQMRMSTSTSNTTFSRVYHDSTSTVDSNGSMRPLSIAGTSSGLSHSNSYNNKHGNAYNSGFSPSSSSQSLNNPRSRMSRQSVNLTLDLAQSRYPTDVRTSIYGRVDLPSPRRRSMYGSQVMPLFSDSGRPSSRSSARQSPSPTVAYMARQAPPRRVQNPADLTSVTNDIEEIFSQARRQRDTLLMMADTEDEDDNEDERHEYMDAAGPAPELVTTNRLSNTSSSEESSYKYGNKEHMSVSPEIHQHHNQQHEFAYPRAPDLVSYDDESPTSEGIITPMPSTPSLGLGIQSNDSPSKTSTLSPNSFTKKMQPKVIVTPLEHEGNDDSDSGRPVVALNFDDLHPDIAPMFKESSRHIDRLRSRLDRLLSDARSRG